MESGTNGLNWASVEWLIAFALVLFAAFRFIRLQEGRGFGRRPLDELMRRYAKGEIDEAEYRRTKQVLSEK
ncbi:SHOCT domain-containing protein [Cohnella zeiphila]|uniref:SHOCT domain-containing protein n=1 Tax=Cohnella zeiphila TaxID=2761120 RepID=A0A7X0SSZ7_9BACL|nr:SHOCT domain-containing protein [Cohnella zeiphila]MBB6734564.1 SHOCT domain-containing protein [Cohnella zeiphila]